MIEIDHNHYYRIVDSILHQIQHVSEDFVLTVRQRTCADGEDRRSGNERGGY